MLVGFAAAGSCVLYSSLFTFPVHSPAGVKLMWKYTCLCVDASSVYTADQVAQSISNSKKQFDSAESSHKTYDEN